MIPKEKAIELVDRFIHYVNCWDDETADPNYTQAYNYSKQCALIAIDFLFKHDIGYDRDGVIHDEISIDDEYWKEVRKEIELL
jgi:hypothetical protein